MKITGIDILQADAGLADVFVSGRSSPTTGIAGWSEFNEKFRFLPAFPMWILRDCHPF